MGILTFNEISKETIDNLRVPVEEKSGVIDDVINAIISKYCGELDNYVEFIHSILADSANPPTNDELDDFCMNLATLIYFAGSMCEQIGIRDDISRAVYKEVYNTSRNAQEKGTVADKDTAAELQSQPAQIVNICYNRAYKIMKAKVDNAQELLGSCKKVVSRRMSELELTHLQR